jgi:hypothetical protein
LWERFSTAIYSIGQTLANKIKEIHMHPLIESLIKDGPAVTDGSWGTQMQKRGLKRGQNPDSWNLSHADQVREVAEQYVDAGSQIILTNTFGASRLSLANFKLDEKTVEIIWPASGFPGKRPMVGRMFSHPSARPGKCL